MVGDAAHTLHLYAVEPRSKQTSPELRATVLRVRSSFLFFFGSCSELPGKLEDSCLVQTKRKVTDFVACRESTASSYSLLKKQLALAGRCCYCFISSALYINPR